MSRPPSLLLLLLLGLGSLGGSFGRRRHLIVRLAPAVLLAPRLLRSSRICIIRVAAAATIFACPPSACHFPPHTHAHTHTNAATTPESADFLRSLGVRGAETPGGTGSRAHVDALRQSRFFFF